MRLPLLRPVLALGLALGLPSFPLVARAAAVQSPDYAVLLGDYPRPGSDGDKADQAILLWLQRSRTPEDIQRAASEVEPHLGLFDDVTGQDLESGRFPLTQALAEQARKDIRAVTASLKDHFARPRPYLAMPGLAPAIHRETSFSYPSGHSSWAIMEAALLARFQPGNREAILARGRQVGFDRALGGVHYPSDVDAGQRLGAAFAEAWLDDPVRAAALERTRAAEWR